MVTNYHQTGEALQPTTVSPRVFKFLKRYAEQLHPHERLVVLSFNEFAFKDYVPMTPKGYNGGEKLPSHLVVPCIRFVVSKRFHLLGSLFFDSDYLATKPDKFSRDMSECFKLYIWALENVNLKVIATICPLNAVFHHAVEILTKIPNMEDYDGPLVYSLSRNDEIIHIHDPTYIRNGMIRLFMSFDLAFTLNGKEFLTSRYDITDVLQLNNRPPFLQKAPNNSKYYNQISHYYFNEHISVGIRRLIKQGFLEPAAIGTSIFINMFRQLFYKVYGLDNEDCEIFDFHRMHEYIEFVKSIHASPYSSEEEDDEQDEAAGLPVISEESTNKPKKTNSKPNQPLNSLEQLGLDHPKSLASLKQADMYEPIMIRTASGKTFIPVDPAPPSKKTKAKNRKKNKKERKRQKKNSELLEQQKQMSKTETKLSDSKKDDLVLFYQNPPRDPPDNGEFVLCTPEKYEEIQASSRKTISQEQSCSGSNLAGNQRDKHSETQLTGDSTEKWEDSEKQKKNTLSKKQKKVPQNEKKVLSPVQNRADINLLERSPEAKRSNKKLDRMTLQNPNLNENVRKYINVNRTSLSAVRKIDLDDESNKENITKSSISNIPESVMNFTAEKFQDLNLDDEIKDISYSISDPDDSTEYNFEQNSSLSNKTDDIIQEASNTCTEQSKINELIGEDILSKETIDMLVQNYLSKDQVKSLFQLDATFDGKPKFDSFIKYLQDRNAQYLSLLNDENNSRNFGSSEPDLLKICLKGDDRVDIERVSADRIKPHPSDLFQIHRDNVFNLTDYNVPTIIERNEETGEMEVEVTTYKVKAFVRDSNGNPVDIGGNQPIEGDIQPKLKTSSLKPGLAGVSKPKLVTINPWNLPRLNEELSDHFPLEINENVQFHENTERLDVSDSTSDDSLPNTARRLSLIDYRSRYLRNLRAGMSKEECGETSGCGNATNLDCSRSDMDESSDCNDSPSNDLRLIQKTGSLASHSDRSNIEAYDHPEPGTCNTELNNMNVTTSHSLSLNIPRLNNPIQNPNIKNKRYLSIKDGCSSDGEGDFEIIDRLEKKKNTTMSDSEKDQAKGAFPGDPTDKCFSSDFNSEYDDFDDMIINKHVKMIINKLEEKDEEIARVKDKLDIIEKYTSPSTTKEHSLKRGYVKKEIYSGGEGSKTGATKRTIFHRDKTEESATPTDVIKTSENSCDKSKIASTKASYNETLGVKTKKQLAMIREEQYKKVANTISQTIRRFSSIFNLQDSDEEKTTRISRASLDFVYDLKKVNEVGDIKMKQELLDDAYDRLCLSILGNNANNPNVQNKMKELMPILQEIASPQPKEPSPDSTADSILSQHVNKTISSAESVKINNCRPSQDQYVREDVPNLWINNIKGIDRLFKRLGAEKVYFELSPELFRTDYVEHIMNFIQINGPSVESFPVDDRCLPVNLPECFDTLKPHGSTMLLDE